VDKQRGAALPLYVGVGGTGCRSPTALTDLWARLKHRFGKVDKAREAVRRFEARKQSETESVVEFEQALCVLYREAWSTAPADQRDSALKRRFEDGVYILELSQYLRLHCRDLNFEQTVERARIYATTVESTKPKKFVRFVGEASTPPRTVKDLTPLVDQLKSMVNEFESMKGQFERLLRDKSPAKSSTPPRSPTPSPTPLQPPPPASQGQSLRGPRPAQQSSASFNNNSGSEGHVFRGRRSTTTVTTIGEAGTLVSRVNAFSTVVLAQTNAAATTTSFAADFSGTTEPEQQSARLRSWTWATGKLWLLRLRASWVSQPATSTR